MQEIQSKINNILLHAIYRMEDFKQERQDISCPHEFLQVAALKLPLDKTFKPHQHLAGIKETKITQEAWVVIRGKVEVYYYDMDGEFLELTRLNAGDVSITFYGGHNYLSLEEDTLVYEFKTGPYLGQEKDKVFI